MPCFLGSGGGGTAHYRGFQTCFVSRITVCLAQVKWWGRIRWPNLNLVSNLSLVIRWPTPNLVLKSRSQTDWSMTVLASSELRCTHCDWVIRYLAACALPNVFEQLGEDWLLWAGVSEHYSKARFYVSEVEMGLFSNRGDDPRC